MVREGKGLFLVATEMELGVTKKQSDEILKDPEFQRTLRGEKLRFYRELASDPGRSKQSNIGTLLFLCDQLIAKEQFDKAANVLMSVMKAEGQLEDKTTVNVFADLSAKELEEIRVKAGKRAHELAN